MQIGQQSPIPTEETLSRLLETAEKYKTDNRNFDRRILLEMYGFALALSQELKNAEVKKRIEVSIVQAVKMSVFEEFYRAKSVGLANLGKTFNGYRQRLLAIRRRSNLKDDNLAEFLENAQKAFERLINDMFKYVHNILGRPPEGCQYAAVGIGSLATQLVTPYSDIEYFILVDRAENKTRDYFINFADLFELLVIGLGESPIYKAESLLAEFKEYFHYIKKGQRLDEQKRPQAFNRLFGSLIVTPEELLEKLPEHIVFEDGNHLTAALLTTRNLDLNGGDEALYTKYHCLYAECLQTKEYIKCLRTLLDADIDACRGFTAELTNKLHEEPHKEIEIKHILIHAVHSARELAIFLRACGETIEIEGNIFDILSALKRGKYISEEMHQEWHDLVKKLLILRLQKQIGNRSADAKIKLDELDEIFAVQDICDRLEQVTDFVEAQLRKYKNIAREKESDAALVGKVGMHKKSDKPSSNLPTSSGAYFEPQGGTIKGNVTTIHQDGAQGVAHTGGQTNITGNVLTATAKSEEPLMAVIGGNNGKK